MRGTSVALRGTRLALPLLLTLAGTAWAQPPGQAPEGEPAETLRKPVSERELLELIETLQAATGSTADRPSKRALGSPDRLRVVLDDVTALLVSVHARESRKQLDTAGRSGVEVRQWLEGQVAAVESCVSGRFEGRGGAAAHQASLALVEKHRSKLEPLVLGLRQPAPSESPAAGKSAR
jgi:hypothetical protein